MNRTVIYELAWILPSIAIPIGMLVAILVTTFGMHIHVPSDFGTIQAAAVAETAPFNQPGLTQVGPGHYQATLVTQAWAFQPNEIKVPVGSEVEFVATSRDVIHGFRIDGTNINTMVIPGRIARAAAKFDQPGEYLFVCHEYCGIGHQAMFGKVIVEGTR